MTRICVEMSWNKEKKKLEPVHTWTFSCTTENSLTVCKDGNEVKTIRVIHDANYVYHLSPHAIYANGGARGLYEWLDKSIAEEFADCNAFEVLHYIIERTIAA